MHNEKVFFQKAKYLVKSVKKCFLKKLSVWLTLIKLAVWGLNYEKGQSICKSISSRLGKFLYYLNNQQFHLLFVYPLFYFLFFNQIYSFLIFIFSFPIHSQQLYFSTKNVTSIIFLQYFHKNHNKILYGKLLLVLIWTHHWNYIFTHWY